MVFVMRKLDRVPATLGAKLRALRRGQAVSLGDIERETHVQRAYLDALEHGDYAALPEPIYTRNFIRAYARALNADEKYFLELYDEECGCSDLLDPSRLPRQRVKRGSFFNLPRAVTAGFMGLFATLVIGYFGWQWHVMLQAPVVVLDAPGDGLATNSALLPVTGKITSGEATLTINGEPVVVNADHSFATTVDLQRGLNIITLEAKRRYSHSALIYRRIVFEPKSSTVSFAP